MNRRQALKFLAAGAAVVAVPAVVLAESAPKPYIQHFANLLDGKHLTLKIFDKRYTLEQGYRPGYPTKYNGAAIIKDENGNKVVAVNWIGDIYDYAEDQDYPFNPGCHKLVCSDGSGILYMVEVTPG